MITHDLNPSDNEFWPFKDIRRNAREWNYCLRKLDKVAGGDVLVALSAVASLRGMTISVEATTRRRSDCGYSRAPGS